MIHIPTISKVQLSTWVSFLKKDAEKNGGTGSMLFVCEGENIKVTCWKDLVITEIFSDADFLQLQSLFADAFFAGIFKAKREYPSSTTYSTKKLARKNTKNF